MASPTEQTSDGILDAARGLVMQGGASAATVPAIALASGAPVATLAHQFGSREDLLARLWIRAAQRSQAAVLAAMRSNPDPREAAVAAGLAVFDFVLTNPEDARLLVSIGRADLFGVPSTPDLRIELEQLNEPVIAGLRELAERLTGTPGRAVVDSLAMAVIDIPHGAVRRHLSEDGQPPPARLRRGLEVAIRGALDTIERSRFEYRNGRAALRIV
ncbi:MAG: TetR/AcrR family transcriptional regulator [Solirubrobacteraceae bacterium]